MKKQKHTYTNFIFKCYPIHRKRQSIKMYFVYEQLLDIADKDFKSSVINMFNKLREKYPKY